MQPRVNDYVYFAGLTFLIVGSTAIGVAMFVFHIDTYDRKTGICQIGLAKPIAAVLLGWDVFVNIFLTAVFVRRCEPYMVGGLRGTFLYPAIRGFRKKFSHQASRQEQGAAKQQ